MDRMAPTHRQDWPHGLQVAFHERRRPVSMSYHEQSACPHCNGSGWQREDDHNTPCLFCKPKPNAAAALVIMQKAADVFGTTVEDILGSKRTQHVADARAVCQWAISTKLKIRGNKIANLWKCTESAVSTNRVKVRSHKLLLKVAQEL